MKIIGFSTQDQGDSETTPVRVEERNGSMALALEGSRRSWRDHTRNVGRGDGNHLVQETERKLGTQNSNRNRSNGFTLSVAPDTDVILKLTSPSFYFMPQQGTKFHDISELVFKGKLQLARTLNRKPEIYDELNFHYVQFALAWCRLLSSSYDKFITIRCSLPNNEWKQEEQEDGRESIPLQLV
ncbi:hypothetical protein CBL_11040 [Carabus blaptoides fortunei]